MLHYSIKTASIALATALSITIPSVAEAVTFNFDWKGQIAGLQVTGSFSYDGTQSYLNGIVSTNDLDSLTVSFFDPAGNLMRTYENNHLDPWVNFNFDLKTKQILQAGSFNAPDGINIGAPNYDVGTCFPSPSGAPSGAASCGNDLANASGLTFWSKPPRSSTPHLHVDDWADEFGISPGFPPHEEISFPTRTTQELIDIGRVGAAYLPPNGTPVTPLDGRGLFARVTPVPEPSSMLGLFGCGFLGMRAARKHK